MSVLVGKKAPDFKSPTIVKGNIVEDYQFSEQIKGKYAILFFYPLDFTFVCPTELHAFQEKLSEFEKLGVKLVACSIDSKFSHLAWLNTPKNKGGIQGVQYDLVSDINKTIARDYDVLVEGEGVAYRGLFLIDQKGVVQHQVVNNLDLGRSVEETLRMVKALQFTEKHGEVCPANWNEGDQAMTADQKGLEKFFAKA